MHRDGGNGRVYDIFSEIGGSYRNVGWVFQIALRSREKFLPSGWECYGGDFFYRTVGI